jgi:hypothetical protein
VVGNEDRRWSGCCCCSTNCPKLVLRPGGGKWRCSLLLERGNGSRPGVEGATTEMDKDIL